MLFIKYIIGILYVVSSFYGIAYADDSASTKAADDSSKAENETVVTLTKDNFDEFINKQEFTIVEFYAPWCGHCKRLAPEYETAAKALKQDNILLAKVDVTAEEELGTRFNIKGFPTLKIFRNGKENDYAGGRTSDSIVQYVKKMTGPAYVQVKSMTEATESAKDYPVAFVGHFKSKESEAYLTFTKHADAERTAGAYFVMISNKGDDTVLAIRTDEGKTQPMKITSPEMLKTYTTTEKFPLFGGIDTSNYADYFGSGKDMVWMIGSSENFTALKSVMREVAPNYRERLHFVWLDSAQFKEHAASALGVSEIPAVVIQIKEARYMYNEKNVNDAKLLKQFIDDALEGKIERHLMSEPVPEDIAEEPVKAIVGSNMMDKVFEANKDVFLEVYAPWCGHCKQFEKIYNEFALSMKENTKLAVYKMDGTKNESPNSTISWQGFPTIFFFPSENKTPVPYEGARTIEGLTEFYDKYKSEAPKDTELPKDEF